MNCQGDVREEPEKPTILVVGNFLSGSAFTRSVCEDLSDRLEDRGWRVVRTSMKRSRYLRPLDMLATVFRSRDLLDCALIDVYSGHAFMWAEAVCLALCRLRKPFILTLHGGNLPGFARRCPRRVRRLLCSATAVTAPSGYLMKEMRAWRRDILLLPNPLNLAAYESVQRQTASPRLIWLRAFHRIYNPMLAPKVLALLHDDFPDVQLTMIGPDKGDGTLQETRETAKSLGVVEHIELLGGVPKSEVPRQLNQSNVFLNTTNVDNAPISVLEAMSCGLCVVSTTVGGVSYLLEDGQDALLVPPNDPEAMAAAVRRILIEPGLAERLSINARRKAEQCDWSIVLPQWMAVLNAAATSVPL